LKRAGPSRRTTKAIEHHATALYSYVSVALEEPFAYLPGAPEFADPARRTIFQFYEYWQTSPMRGLKNSFGNSHFSLAHGVTFGVAASPRPRKYELVKTTPKQTAQRKYLLVSMPRSPRKTKEFWNRPIQVR